MSKFYSTKEGVYPTDEQVAGTRQKKHANHLDYFYGDYWSIYMDKDHRCFIECDIGHFASKFIVRQISREDYAALKKDKSLFESVVRQFT